MVESQRSDQSSKKVQKSSSKATSPKVNRNALKSSGIIFYGQGPFQVMDRSTTIGRRKSFQRSSNISSSQQQDEVRIVMELNENGTTSARAVNPDIEVVEVHADVLEGQPLVMAASDGDDTLENMRVPSLERDDETIEVVR